MLFVLLFLSVILGYGIALLLKSKNTDKLNLLLAFSGAFLLSLTVFELLPEVFEEPSKAIGIWIMTGILLQICLEFFSKGAEHGHVHLHTKNKKFPWLLFISLSIHAFLEGFPVAIDNTLLYGVLIHKIPIAIILSLFFIQAQYSKTVTISFLLLFALMTPIGNYLSDEIALLKTYETEISALVIGIFLHVSTTILFESSKDHKFNLAKMSVIVLATVCAYLL
jgi:zinc transporter ZupT